MSVISLKGKRINFCTGCFVCANTHRCVQRDDAAWIAERVKDADTIVFATPVYCYEMSGQMKALIDRMTPLAGTDYNFRNVYMLSTATETEEWVPRAAVEGLKGWVACYPKAEFGGALFCGGLAEPGEAAASEDALRRAYEFGRALK